MKKIVEEINKGNIVGMPTDTVFGLFVARTKQGMSKLNELKDRPSDQPLQVMFASVVDALEVIDVDHNYEEAEKILKEGNSVIGKVRNDYKEEYQEETLLVRVPTAPEELLDVIYNTGPLYATSANRTGEAPLISSKEVQEEFDIITLEGESTGTSSSIYNLIDKVEKVR